MKLLIPIDHYESFTESQNFRALRRCAVLMRDTGVGTGACACHFQVPGAGGDFDARSARPVDLSRVWIRSRGPVGSSPLH